MRLRHTFFSAAILVALSGVAQSPQASFMTIPSFDNQSLVVCAGEPVGFINTSLNTGPLSTYEWDFGFGASPASYSLEGPVFVTYSNVTPATQASLTVNNNDGSAPSTFSISVSVIESPVSDLHLGPDEFEFSESEEDGVRTFTHCNSDGIQLFTWETNEGAGVSQSFDWGDGSADDDETAISGNFISHEYPVGDFVLEHTVTYGNGCADVRSYRVFNGSAPIVTVSGSGQNTCTPSPYAIDIISNNVPIDYIVSYSDIADIEEFNTANDTTLNHIFQQNSCGEQYVISPILPPIENAYSATLIASNLCSANGIPTVFTIGPITVSSGPEPIILPLPLGPLCQDETLLLTSVGLPGETVTVNGCDDTTLTHWTIVESEGWVLELGNLGASNGATGEDYVFGAWDDGSEVISLGFDAPGTYHIWLHTGNGCGEDSTEYTVQVNPFGNISPPTASSSICSGDTVIPITWTSSQPDYLISWTADVDEGLSGVEPTLGIGLGPLQSPDNWSVENTTDEIQYIEVTANVGCTSNPDAVWTIAVYPQINLEKESLDGPVCSGEDWQVVVGTNVSGVDLTWTADVPDGVVGCYPGAGDVIDEQLINSTNNPQTVTYTLITPNEVCPMDPVEYEVIVLPQVIIPTVDDMAFCPNDVVEIPNYDLPIDGLVWSWENDNTDVGLGASGNGILDGFNAETNDTGESIVGTVTVNVEQADCPVETTNFTLTLYPSPEASFEVGPNGGVSCVDGMATITATTTAASPQFEWGGPNVVTSSGSAAEVEGEGTYEVTVLDGLTGCASTFEVEVLPPDPMDITSIDFVPPNCFGGSDGWIDVFTNESTALTFAWLPSDIDADGGYAASLASGSYTVLITNGSECQDSATIELIDFDPLTLALVETVDSECGEANGSIEVVASGGQGGYTYQWGVFQNNALLDGVDEGLYDVEATDAGGCEVEGTFEVACYPLTPIIPSQLLTPNDDGFNDTWVVEYLWMYPDHNVKVFNRWGTQVFEAEPYDNNWAGTWDPALGSAKLLPAGTYYYLIDTRKKSQKPFRGFIELQHEER